MDAQGNKIIAVDFDGTLTFGKWPEVGPPNLILIEYLKRHKAEGARLILWTCRTGELLDVAVRYCESYGLTFDAVNDNLPDIMEIFGTNSRKIAADIYFDDKAINPFLNAPTPPMAAGPEAGEDQNTTNKMES